MLEVCKGNCFYGFGWSVLGVLVVKVNFKEFFHGLFDMVRNYDEEGHHSSHQFDDSMEAPAKKLFAQLYKDGDGY